MKTINKPTKNKPQPKMLSWQVAWLVTFVLGIAAYAFFSWTSTPKLIADDEAIKTMDAMFTAINSRNREKVASCRDRLEKLAADGKLNSSAMSVVNRCSNTALAGSWESAAKSLYQLVYDQRS